MQLILLPGMDGTGILFKPFIDELPQDLAVNPISYPDNEHLNYQQLADLVRKSLPIEEEFIIVAESYSGPVAYLLVQENIPNLKSIVFVTTFLRSPRPLLLKILATLPLEFLFSFAVPHFIVKRLLFGLNAKNENISLFYKAMEKPNPRVLAERLRDISNLSIHLKQLNVRAAYIQAKEDKLVPSSNASAFIKCFKTLNVYQISGPHFLLQSNPQECARIVLEEIILFS